MIYIIVVYKDNIMIYVIFTIITLSYIFKKLCKLGVFGNTLKEFFIHFDLDHIDLTQNAERIKVPPVVGPNHWYYPIREDEEED